MSIRLKILHIKAFKETWGRVLTLGNLKVRRQTLNLTVCEANSFETRVALVLGRFPPYLKLNDEGCEHLLASELIWKGQQSV
jgi:hypothetical protein